MYDRTSTEAELGLYNGGSQYGTWAAVMEKAFGQYRLNHASDVDLKAIAASAHTPQDGAGGEGYATDALSLLTGKLNRVP